jgi:hypothetical protein
MGIAFLHLVLHELLEGFIRFLALELIHLNYRVRELILDEEFIEGNDRDAMFKLRFNGTFLAPAQRLFHESLHLLSHSEETMTEQLVDGECEAVVQHRLFEAQLLNRHALVGLHQLVRVVLDHLVLGVEEARGEGGGVVFFELLLLLVLGAGASLGIVASQRRVL